MDNAINVVPLSWYEIDVLRDLMYFDGTITRDLYGKVEQANIDRLIQRGLVIERDGDLVLNMEGST